MEKRSISEKVLPTASLKKLNGLPFAVPTSQDIRQASAVKENSSPGLAQLKPQRHPSEQIAALPIIYDYENKMPQSIQKAQLKKTASAFQLHNCNNNSAQKPLVSHPFLAITQQRGSTNVRSPKNDKFRQRLTHAGYEGPIIKQDQEFNDLIDNRENSDVNAQRFSSTSKANLIQNALRMSKLTSREKSKSKRNILSIDPIARTEAIKRDSVRAPTTAAKLPEHIPKNDYIDLYIENMMLKEHCRGNESIKKMLFDNLLNSKIGEQIYKPPPSVPDFGTNKEGSANPWFLLTQGVKPEQLVKQEQKYQTPDPKNCCVNVINNNYHINFVSPIKRESRRSDAFKVGKQVAEVAWRDKLSEYVQNNVKPNAFKKRFCEENTNEHASLQKYEALINHRPQAEALKVGENTNKPYRIKASSFKQRSPEIVAKLTKAKMPTHFLEDSATHRDTDVTDKEEHNEIGQMNKMPCNDIKCDTLNFTFSNFKVQPK